MKLSEWLEQNDITQAQFAAMIGMSQPVISLICNGKQFPSMGSATKIRDATGGAVSADDFLPPMPADEAAE